MGSGTEPLRGLGRYTAKNFKKVGVETQKKKGVSSCRRFLRSEQAGSPEEKRKAKGKNPQHENGSALREKKSNKRWGTVYSSATTKDEGMFGARGGGDARSIRDRGGQARRGGKRNVYIHKQSTPVKVL